MCYTHAELYNVHGAQGQSGNCKNGYWNGSKQRDSLRLAVLIVEDLGQQIPADPRVHTELQQNALISIAGCDHTAVHEVELDEFSTGQIQIHRHQLTRAALAIGQTTAMTHDTQIH